MPGPYGSEQKCAVVALRLQIFCGFVSPTNFGASASYLWEACLRMHGILSGACRTILRPVRPKNGGVLDFGANSTGPGVVSWTLFSHCSACFRDVDHDYCRLDLCEIPLPQACGVFCLGRPKMIDMSTVALLRHVSWRNLSSMSLSL